MRLLCGSRTRLLRYESIPRPNDQVLTLPKRQDNITTLLDLLEAREFYSRLYSLQLISHICSARPERTQECIFTAPLGISKLVNVLTDSREPVRNGTLCGIPTICDMIDEG